MSLYLYFTIVAKMCIMANEREKNLYELQKIKCYLLDTTKSFPSCHAHVVNYSFKIVNVHVVCPKFTMAFNLREHCMWSWHFWISKLILTYESFFKLWNGSLAKLAASALRRYSSVWVSYSCFLSVFIGFFSNVAYHT